MTHDEWVAGFWKRVARLGPRQCWPWKGTVTTSGYGQLKRAGGKTNDYAHRVSVELKSGQRVPKGMVVMHMCDNPLCVNPSHLRVATQRENVQDMLNKGRAKPPSVRGERHGSAKLSDDQTLELRAIWDMRHTDPRITQEALAKKYGISQSQVSRIVNRQRRK